MTLFQAAIQEFLEANHPGWSVAPYVYYEDIVIIDCPHLIRAAIAINTHKNCIVHTDASDNTVRTYYDHNNFLQKLSEAICQK
jgi:hypothetical protein